jgi:hypothetical protein
MVEALDFVVDYSTYVFVPALVLMRGGLLSPLLADIAGVLVVVVGGLYFADKRMKTADNAFRGFPALWNVVAYLLMIYRPPEAVSFGIVAALAVMTFMPLEFVHPLRVVRWRPLTIAVTIVWAVLAIVALWDDLNPAVPVKMVLRGVMGVLNAGWYAILQAKLYDALPGRSGTALAVGNFAGLVGGLIPLGLGLAAQAAGLGATMWLLLAGPLALLIGLPRGRGEGDVME